MQVAVGRFNWRRLSWEGFTGTDAWEGLTGAGCRGKVELVQVVVGRLNWCRFSWEGLTGVGCRGKV